MMKGGDMAQGMVGYEDQQSNEQTHNDVTICIWI